jgi:uncharacterized protein (DUF342 family)
LAHPEASHFARPGQVIADITPPTEAKTGTNVLGKEIKAKNGKACDLKAGKNAHLSEDGTCFTAGIYGVVEVVDRQASVRVPIDMSDDRMSADLVVCRLVADNSVLEMEEVLSVLEHENVVHGIRQDAIESALKSGRPVQTVRVAQGTPAEEHPEASHFARPGQVIADITPPTEAKTGTNVLGKEIKAKNGKACDLKAGKNAHLSEDSTCFTADIYGVVEVVDRQVVVRVPIDISDDRMSADLAICRLVADNSALEMEDVLSVLEHANVVHGIMQDAIESALKSGRPVQTVRIAEGTPQKDGVDARFEYYFKLGNRSPEEVDSERNEDGFDDKKINKEIFTAGELLAVKIPLVLPEDGCTVFGKELKARKPHDRNVSAGEGVEVTDDNLRYVVAEKAMGYANLVNGSLCIEDPVQVSEDRLTVYVCVHPPSGDNRLLTVAMVKKRLKELGVKRGIDENAIEQVAQKTSSASEPICDVPITKGKTPQKGEDATFKFGFRRNKQPGKYVGEAGRMDFRERGTIHNAKAGDVIAEKILPTAGKDGFDVFGDVLQAEPGRDWDLTPIENVSVSEDGRIYKAEIDGMITLLGKEKIGILKAYEIPGDVDLTTGNLKMKGSLTIKGWVREGFSVMASGDISVGQGVEDSVVRAGANLVVNRGIVGGGKGRVIAKGDVRADFMENARVNAGGDVIVNNAIVRCLVTARGSVDITSGKGQLRGSRIFALKGVRAKEIGSGVGIETIIKVGRVPRVLKMMAGDKKFLASRRKNRQRILGAQECNMLNKLKKVKRQEAKLGARQARHMKLLKDELDQGKTSAFVEVVDVVHEGTIVKIQGYSYRVTKELKGRGKFILDRETQTVEFV